MGSENGLPSPWPKAGAAIPRTMVTAAIKVRIRLILLSALLEALDPPTP